jgi:hypothetical protein
MIAGSLFFDLHVMGYFLWERAIAFTFDPLRNYAQYFLSDYIAFVHYDAFQAMRAARVDRP